MKFEIKNRWSGEVQFAAEIECDEDANCSLKLGLAVKAALAASADLRSANLESANLRSADLRSADLESANLESANLEYANLESADLRSANLESANLESANLEYADLSYQDFILCPIICKMSKIVSMYENLYFFRPNCFLKMYFCLFEER